ncbi:hypothetical protein [uncultured Roseibium sp.]|uniref:hypothetical protein n=1 Tax=uncultured Roseibium sp. TaxID=1936171 RepID=UPI002619D9AE|nr:hypothetical protein [uncultured Roseibium sp.]
MKTEHKIALKVASILWVIWGLVHVLAALLIIPVDPQTAIGNIADAVDKATLVGEYPEPLSGILSQHGWNLGWFGVTTIVGAVFIWRGNMTAIWVTGLVGGLADVGYFVFIDLPGYANFIPGTLMTLVSGSAVILSFWVWLANRASRSLS